MRKVITAFKEHKEFQKRRPWDVVEMHFNSDIITPPHYAETIEILLYHNVKGTAYIGGNRYELAGDQVYFVAPNVIHSMYYQRNDGISYTLKLNLDGLAPMLSLQTILSEMDLTFSDFPCLFPEYSQMTIIAEILRNARQPTLEALGAILSIFRLLQKHCPESSGDQPQPGPQDAALREIISWTEEHFAEKISLDEIAEKIGYNKHYFCKKFKTATGETYLHYLNNLRIYHACRLLKLGNPIHAVCEQCGFDNISYFIQLFRKTVGTTPKQYAIANGQD